MPVIATLGSLTYSTTTDGTPFFEYWAIMPNNIGNTTFKDIALDSSNIVYTLSESNTGNIVTTQVSGPVNPKMLNCVTSQPAPLANTVIGSNNAIKLAYLDNNVYAAGSINAQRSDTSPFYEYVAGAYTIISNTTGNAGTYTYTAPINPTANNNRLFNMTDLAYSNNAILMFGKERGPDVSTFTIGIALTQGNGASQITRRIYESNTTSFANVNATSVELDTTGNIVTFYDYPQDGTNRQRLFLRKFDKTPTGSPLTYPEIWKQGLQTSNSSHKLFSTEAIIDNNDDIYCTAVNTTLNEGLILKLDSSGNLIWQNSIANVLLHSITLESNANIFVSGRIGANIWISQIDSNGNIQWQNEISGSSNFSGNVKLIYNANSLYIGSQFGTRPLIIKIPSDGTILGTGNYKFTDNSTLLNYTSSNIALTASNLTTFTSATNSIVGPVANTLARTSNNTALSNVARTAYLS
jgi:hypothetical protein